MQEMKIERHYQLLEAKILVTRHKQHFKFQFSLGMVAKW
jgi:hypothetical protein